MILFFKNNLSIHYFIRNFMLKIQKGHGVIIYFENCFEVFVFRINPPFSFYVLQRFKTFICQCFKQ